MEHQPFNYFRQQLELARAMRMLQTLADMIERARATTARARRARQTRLMLTARHTGQQLDAAQRQLSTIYDRELLDATSAFITAAHAALDAIDAQLNALDAPTRLTNAIDRLRTA